jgi:glycosyltransferase involved in cell wall biosynthesis
VRIMFSVDSVRFPLTGIGQYTYELAKQLQKQNDLTLLLFANNKIVFDLPGYDEAKQPKVTSMRMQLRKSSLVIRAYQLLSEIKSQLSLRPYRDAIFHGPGFYLPRFAGPSVATFHDLSIFTWSHCHPPERVFFMRRELNLTLQRASLLITDSEHTRLELSEYFDYPLDKIRTIPLACSSDFHPREALDTNPILNKFNLKHGGYTLYAGTIEPRKNIETLLDSYGMLPDTIKTRYPLVISGYYGWQSDVIHARIEAAVNAGWAHYLGYVANDDLPILFAGARIFVFPSHYEGFGLPVLEAMASGIPVVCSNASSLPEVVGDAALTCHPLDVDKLNQLIVLGLEDESWRVEAVAKGLEQSLKFSWERCAKETIAVYRELITGHNI